MENDNNAENKIRENKPSSDNRDAKLTEKSEDDSFKSSEKEHRLGWEQPSNEQQTNEGGQEPPTEKASD